MAIFYTFSITFYVIGVPCLVSERLTYMHVKLWCKITILLVRIFGIKSKIINAHKAPNGPAIICCKHQSYYEIILLFATLNKSVFVMKESIMKIPVYAWYCKKLGMIAVNRRVINKDWQDKASAQLNQNKQLVIFPEGTRVPNGRRIEYKKGAFKLAENLGMQIYPVSTNAGTFWKGGGMLSGIGEIYIHFHDPVDPTPENVRNAIESV